MVAIRDEVMKTLDMLKKAGYNPVDAVFEGAVGVKEDTTLAFMDKLNDKQLVSGVIRIIYTADGEQVRFVEIPVGQGGEQQLEQQMGSGAGQGGT
ncbi:MAG TPA: hypothetical protein VI874_03980 [Candidatus Norongarragalinales archaeon]|nr:hypothetical protein [Candidatus Norongarragalinales archaeon]